MTLLEKAKQVLTPRELKYFQIMNGKAGTLYIEGPPGGGKSAIFKSIAEKLGGRYLPFDAPAMEETEIGLYPKTLTYKDKEVVKYVPPLWAVDAENSSEPVFIVFEEVNRNIRLMNAILNVLNERRIGFEVKFGPNVFVAATGNLGAEDGTTVEEMDNAQKGRLIIFKHVIDGEEGRVEWEESFAGVPTEDRPNGKVIPLIREYLKKFPANIRPVPDKQSAVIVDSRRWTYLNEAIIANVGYNTNAQEILGFVHSNGAAYVGAYAREFMLFLESQKRWTVEDVLAGRATKTERDNAADLSTQLVALDFHKLKKAEVNNVIAFVKTFDHEMQVAFVQNLFVNALQVELGNVESKDNSMDVACKNVLTKPNIKLVQAAFSKELKYLTDNV